MPADDEPFCRDCADENGTCPHDGTPCDLAAPTGAAAPTRYVCTRCDWQGEAASLTDAQQRHWEANVECTRAANYSSVEPAASPAARAPARAGTTEPDDRCAACGALSSLNPHERITNIAAHVKELRAENRSLRAEVSRLSARTGELEAMVYAPGDWICPTCGFVQSQRTLHVPSGQIGVSDVPALPCPNDGQYMERLSWKQVAKQLQEISDDLLRRAIAAEQALERGR